MQQQSPTASSTTVSPHLWIGLDVGGTKIDALAVDENDVERARVLLPTDTTSGETTVASIIRGVQSVREAAGSGTLESIGLGIPGMVQDGVVTLAIHLNLTAFPLARRLEETFGVPAFLENDVRAASLGAYDWVRKTRPETRSLVYLSLGTGISCGLILNGWLHRGENGMAGEVGHAVIDPTGGRCRCGNIGCLETIAAGWGIAAQGERALAEARASGEQTRLADAETVTAEWIFECARHGDPAALRVTRKVGRYVACAIYNLIMHYDVDVVALGGGVSHAGAVFFDPVHDALAQMASESDVVRAMLRGNAPGEEKVVLLPREADPAGRGVIALARSGMTTRPAV